MFFPFVFFLILIEVSALFIKLQNARYGQLSHGDAVDASGIVDLYVMTLDIIHWNTVKTGGGQLDILQIDEFLNIVSEEQSVADDPRDPVVFTW